VTRAGVLVDPAAPIDTVFRDGDAAVLRPPDRLRRGALLTSFAAYSEDPSILTALPRRASRDSLQL